MNIAARHIGVSACERVEIAGEEGFCDHRGALVFPALRLLVVSDLHLEKGSSFARRGRLIPPYDSAATLLRLAAVIADHDPAIVVSLGDSFHDGEGAARLPDIFRGQLCALMAGREWYWIAGNHDPDVPADLPGNAVQELVAGALTFRHEPAPGRAVGEVAGHLHPGARLVRRGRVIRRPCFASDGHRLIMPAFGAFTGSLNVLDRAFRGMFGEGGFTAYMLGTGRLYAIGSGMLSRG